MNTTDNKVLLDCFHFGVLVWGKAIQEEGGYQHERVSFLLSQHTLGTQNL